MAMAFAFGFDLKRKKLGYSIYGVMLFAYLVGVCINVSQEMGGNPRIDEMGIAQDNGCLLYTSLLECETLLPIMAFFPVI